MSRDKQIEEMAIVSKCTATNSLQCPKTTCAVCRATKLYNAGYRKASDVAEEIFEEIEKVTEIGRIMNACAIVSLDELAELKKKYTEDKE